MKEPDKIYIGSTAMNAYGDIAFTAHWQSEQFQHPFENHEYIRKDALLEWAKGYLELRIYDDKREVMKELIEKLESL